VEPNNKPAEAVGPLCVSLSIEGYPNDTLDYFMFDTLTVGNISVTVNNHSGAGIQLHLYYRTVSSTPVTIDLSEIDGLHVEHKNSRPGRYYILIYTETPRPVSARRYEMQVTFP
jgi:hypothetical protein